MISPYRSSNRIPIAGLLFLLMAVLCAGLVFGGLAFVISRLIWLIILFPIGLGLMGGAILAQIISKRHIRHPMLGLAAGIVMGIVIYGVLHYANYLAFHSELRQLLTEEHNIPDTDLQGQAIDAILAAETGSTGFFGYIKLEAQEGVSIGSIGRSSMLRLNQPLTWGYWLIELCLISGAAALLAREAASKPFCESCQQWYRGGEHLGSVPEPNEQQFLAYVHSGSFRQAGGLLVEDSSSSPSLEVYLQCCQHDQEHPSILAVRHASINRNGNLQFKDVLEGMISAYDVSEITRGQREQQIVLA
jgi:hypothetical protein